MAQKKYEQQMMLTPGAADQVVEQEKALNLANKKSNYKEQEHRSE